MKSMQVIRFEQNSQLHVGNGAETQVFGIKDHFFIITSQYGRGGRSRKSQRKFKMKLNLVIV